MNFLKNSKISVKFGGGMGIILFLLMLVMGIYHTVIKGVIADFDALLNSEVMIGTLTGEVENLMLQCRRNEKDFLLRKDKKYLDRLTGNSDKLIDKALSIKEIAARRGYEDIEHEAGAVIEMISSYRSIFTEVVAGWEEIGLDHKSGIQGRFRQAAHDMADDLQDHRFDNLYTGLLLLRRWEKDFIRTGADKYKERLQKSIATYKEDLEKSTCEENA